MNQTDLFTPQAARPTAAAVAVSNPREPGLPTDADRLRAHLAACKCFRTRAQIAEVMGWSDRQVREAAEQLGPAIVRCQAGFKLTDDLVRDDLGLATQAADAFLSQGKRMIRYAVALRRQLHRIIG